MSEYNRLRDLVLPKDFDYANKLSNCMEDCLKRMIESKHTEDFSHWEKEFNRCSAEFQVLLKEKEDHNHIQSIVGNLRREGVRADIAMKVPYITLEGGGGKR